MGVFPLGLLPGDSTKFYDGRLRSKVKTPYPFVYYFYRKEGTPFTYILLKKVPLSHAFLRTLYRFSKLLE